MENLKNPKLQNKLISLAFDQAKINQGMTSTNPSVGCVVEKNGTVISSGNTSPGGRPHAEFNALSKNINFNNSNIYITMEPCSHFGKTPPCIDLIKKKNIKKVFFSVYDVDNRSRKKSIEIFKKFKISYKSKCLNNYGMKFYQSYFLSHSNGLPLIDAKIAISKDFYTKRIKSRWITNKKSRNISHLLRSMYDCIISTSKSINDDNSLLNCRINGLEKKSPDLIIIDRKLSIKKNLKIFNEEINRKIVIFTTNNNQKKISFLKRKNIKVYILKSLNNNNDYNTFFLMLKKLKYNRLFIETGLTFLNFLIKNSFINYIFLFKSNIELKKNGLNNSNNNLIKKIKLKNKIKVYLQEDILYKERLK